MKLLDVLAKEMKEWPEGGHSVGQATDGTLYVNDARGEFLYHTTEAYSQPSVGKFYTDEVTKDMWEDAKVKNESKHKHAEMIALCAEFAQTMEDPMTMFQYKGICDKEWQNIPATGSVIFYEVNEYRLKPKTKLINGVEIPDLPFTPFVGCEFYCANIGLPEFYETGYMGSGGCTFTKRMAERDLIYPYTQEGREAAILHSKALLGITGDNK